MRTLARLALASALTAALPLAAAPVFAAAPDGLGPWADTVVTSNQTNTKAGIPVSTVNPARSDPTNALGVAENNTVDSSFFSLGFGGSITLSFDNGISSGVFVVEATNPGYPNESAKVEISQDGTTWLNAGTVTQDGEVAKPESLTCAKYVRITDQSDPDDFSDATADAFDVDGVKAQGHPCTPPSPSPSPGGGCCGCTNIKQSNTSSVTNVVSVSSNTGKNSASLNTGGNTAIVTGNTSQSVSITNGGNTNVANTGAGCCPGGNTSVTISGNGALSKNTVVINNGSSKKGGKSKLVPKH